MLSFAAALILFIICTQHNITFGLRRRKEQERAEQSRRSEILVSSFRKEWWKEEAGDEGERCRVVGANRRVGIEKAFAVVPSFSSAIDVSDSRRRGRSKIGSE